MSRRIVLLTQGTRGDVDPFIALALGLRAAGHTVRLAAPPDFAEEARRRDLDFAPYGPPMRALFTDPAFLALRGRGLWKSAPAFRRLIAPGAPAMLADAIAATRDADGLVCHPWAEIGFDIAEARGLPVVLAALQPVTPTRTFPVLAIKKPSLGPVLNHASFRLAAFRRVLLAPEFARARRSLGLGPRNPFAWPYRLAGKPVPTLQGISAALFTSPPDWPPETELTGYWFLDDGRVWKPDRRLEKFLAAGPAPLFIGFGSVPGFSPEQHSRVVAEALRRGGLRALVARGWGLFDEAFLARLPGRIHLLDEVPHEKLFPLVAGVVHHGGTGTLHQGLRAGRPTLVCPVMTDGPWWGRQVARLGVGPPPLGERAWTAHGLAAAFADLASNQDYRVAAEAIGRAIRAENGVARAVAAIGRVFEARH